jgi:signal transduction histidine kinase
MEALDLRVYATPFPYEGHQFTFFVITDISNEKRRLMLEKIFLHDIVNSAVSIKEATKIIAESEPDKMPEFMEILLQSSDSLLEEITTHREIASIESNELYVNISEFNTFALLNKVSGMFPTIQQDKNVSVKIDNVSVDFILHTDKVLLRRVIGNMIKNALEASPGGETVTIGCSILDGKAIFRVHNNNFIPLNLQLQIFQRSFTTKGTGHGIGTYSIKILTEKYLKGKASFTSSEKDGTVFTVSIPTVLK